jgi:hypothetical protein
MEEHWTEPAGGILLGLHRDVKEGRTVLFEFLRIEETPDAVTYWASPKGRPATPFKLVEHAEKRVVFENKDHDFPQRILYWIDADGSLAARIEGTPGREVLVRRVALEEEDALMDWYSAGERQDSEPLEKRDDVRRTLVESPTARAGWLSTSILLSGAARGALPAEEPGRDRRRSARSRESVRWRSNG